MQCTVHIPHVHVHAYNYCTFYLYVSGLKYFVVRRCVVLCLLSPSHSSFLLLSFPLFPPSLSLSLSLSLSPSLPPSLPLSLSLSLSLQMLQVPAWLIMTGAAPLLSLCSQGVEERSNSLHPLSILKRDRKRRRPVRETPPTVLVYVYAPVYMYMYSTCGYVHVCACTCTCMCTTCTCYY